MLDIENEQLRLLTQASADVPGHPHTSTIVRWALRGVRGQKLESVVIGGRRFTSVEAIQRFIARLSDPSVLASVPMPQRRKKEIDRAEQRLDAEGFK